MSTINEILNHVIKTGELPTSEDVFDAIDAGRTVREKQAARKALTIACRKIAAAVREGFPEEAAQLAEGAAYAAGRYTKAGAADIDVSEIYARQREGSRPTKRVDRAALQPLEELLGQAAHGHTVYADDIKQLRTIDAAEDDLAQWRDKVAKAAGQIKRAKEMGNNGMARQLAKEATMEFGSMLRPEEPKRNDDVTDPSELAALISRGQMIA